MSCLQVLEMKPTKPNPAEKTYTYLALNRCAKPITFTRSLGTFSHKPQCSDYVRSQVTFAASEMGTSNWSDLTASLQAFDKSEGLYYGGPLGNERSNAAVDSD